jgi:undecaprenyl-diphosphatase
MPDFFVELDKVLFFLINVYLANPVTDAVMPVFSSDAVLRIVYAMIVLAMLWRGDRRIRWLVLFSAIVMALTDQTSSNLLKHWIERPRPCHTFTDINLLVGCGGGYSLPSSHAANVFGQAFLLSKHIKHSGRPFFVFAILVSLSRVFVGVHYPADILAGMLVGSIMGLIVAWLFRKFAELVLKPPSEAVPDSE